MKSNLNYWLVIAGIAVIGIILGAIVCKAIKYAKSKDFDLLNIIKGLIEPQ